jgi:hypothetical protein
LDAAADQNCTCQPQPADAIGKRHGLNRVIVEQLSTAIQAELDQISTDPITVLEAGGGSSTFLRGFARRLAFTTIDISQEQLNRNTYAEEKILGDVQRFEYGDRHFHVVVCWDVLEHLVAPERALSKMLAPIPIGGIVILKGPIPTSLKGLLTRWTPHLAHVFFYRWILGKSTAGLPGHAPFRTELRPDAGPDKLRQRLQAEGFVLVADIRFITNQIDILKEKLPLGYHIFRILSRVLVFASAGRYGGFHSDFCLVARRASTLPE